MCVRFLSISKALSGNVACGYFLKCVCSIFVCVNSVLWFSWKELRWSPCAAIYTKFSFAVLLHILQSTQSQTKNRSPSSLPDKEYLWFPASGGTNTNVIPKSHSTPCTLVKIEVMKGNWDHIFHFPIPFKAENPYLSQLCNKGHNFYLQTCMHVKCMHYCSDWMHL